MENKIQNLEDELKVLKNEVQAVLLDIKDFLILGGGAGGGVSLAPVDPGPSPFALSDGAVAPPPPQQVIVTQLAPMPVEAPAPPPVTAPEKEPESVEFGPGEDAADQAPLTFEEEPESTGMDWSGGSPDEAGPGTGPEEGPGFGATGWSGGPAAQATTGPGEGPVFAEAGRSEGAANVPAPDFVPGVSDHIDSGDEVDLPMLAILTPWLTRGVATMGKDHTERLVELYDVARDLPPRLKQAILMLLDLHDDCNAGRLSGEALVRETIPLLIELDSLLLRHRTGTLESAVLSLLQERMTKEKKARSRKVSDG
ncbi:MAG: hypothetical protein V3S51_08430 [Dehalococcoidia bacterium]